MTATAAADRLHELLASILPRDVAIAGGGLDGRAAPLFDAEDRAIAKASAQRQREFVAGRGYARAALARLGCPPCPIPIGKDRRPVWPAGYIGSISHTRHLCAVIAAREEAYCGLGIDVESDVDLEPDIQAIVCRPDEWIGTAGRAAGAIAKLVFVAKEAVFKAVYPATNVFLDFRDVRVEFDESFGSFQATLVAEHLPLLAGRRCFTGHLGRIGPDVLAVVTIAGTPTAANRGSTDHL